MTGVICVLLLGLALSAFFSGSETGFYRATRTRLALDALDGDRISRGLLWLTNNPSFFVATTLVGNNFANYVTSWSIVWATSLLWSSRSSGLDLAISLLMTPIIFIYGELMPKNLFFLAPNRLLRIAGPLFLAFCVLFAPLAAILWGLGRLLERIVGESPEVLQLRLARRELKRVFSEGHDAGVLLPMQRQMADGMFDVATLPLARFSVPMTKLAVARQSMNSQEMLRIARRRRSPVLFIQDHRRELIGYLHVIDLHLADQLPRPKPMRRMAGKTSTIAALTTLREAAEPYVAVMGDTGRILGIAETHQLGEMVISAERGGA